jgi:hypothetical protein
MRTARNMFLAASAASLATVFVASTVADAKPRKVEGRELTVKRRPFTDSGNVVPVGSQANYVYDQQYLRERGTFGSPRSSYGAETLPGRFELPGNRPLFNF